MMDFDYRNGTFAIQVSTQSIFDEIAGETSDPWNPSMKRQCFIAGEGRIAES